MTFIPCGSIIIQWIFKEFQCKIVSENYSHIISSHCCWFDCHRIPFFLYYLVVVVGLPYFSKQKSGQSIDQCFSTIDSQYKMIIKSGRMATLNSGNLFWGQTFTMIIIIMELTRWWLPILTTTTKIFNKHENTITIVENY